MYNNNQSSKKQYELTRRGQEETHLYVLGDQGRSFDAFYPNTYDPRWLGQATRSLRGAWRGVKGPGNDEGNPRSKEEDWRR